jgi:beta-xylosidase
MKNGDIAGLGALQANYGYIAVKMENDSRSIVMAKGTPEEGEEIMQEVQLDQNTIYLKSHLDFRDWNDTGTFHYSLNGEEWKPLGSEIKMSYTLPHFMGYRFALFNYASEIAGGYVDFDFFKIE